MAREALMFLASGLDQSRLFHLGFYARKVTFADCLLGLRVSALDFLGMS
jgi:hypothetical protein